MVLIVVRKWRFGVHDTSFYTAVVAWGDHSLETGMNSTGSLVKRSKALACSQVDHSHVHVGYDGACQVLQKPLVSLGLRERTQHLACLSEN